MNVTPRLSDWAGGFCVGTVTSAGVLGERLAAGAPRSAVAGDVATTVAAIAISSALSTRWSYRAYARAALAASAGIVLVHALAATHVAPWMSERPPQFVNDAVAALATLALVFVFARRRLRVACLAAVTALVGVYAATHAMWHLDHAPRPLVATVQQCVVAQFFSVLVALLVYREARSRGVLS